MLRRLVVCALLAVGLSLAGIDALDAQVPPARTPSVTAADVRFMQEMLGHHQQAVAMTALVAGRTRRPQLRVLAERIAVSQTDELAVMRQWLQAHGARVDTSSSSHEQGHHGGGTGDAGHAVAMPGMLTAREMAALRGARGARFDRLFLDGMIRHHVGALTMVTNLLDTPGAAQESSINRFVTDVDADQRAEIARMRRMLAAR